MQTKKNKLLILLICFAINVYAQSPEKPAAGKAEDSTTVNLLLQQSKEMLQEDLDKAMSLAVQAKEIAEKVKFYKGKAYALKNMGLVYYFQGKYLETLGYWNESLEIFEQIKDEIGIANLLNNIAAIYVDQGDDARALEYSLRSLQLSEKAGDKLRILSALNTVGSIYFNKKATWDKALGYFIQALPLCDEIGDKNALGTISENIGEIYFEKNDFANSLLYFNKSLAALENTVNSSFAYNGIGKLYLKEGDYTKALNYHQKALTIAENFSNKKNMVLSFKGIANVYTAQNDYPAALMYYKKASTIAEEIKAAPDLKDIYHLMADAFAKTEDYRNAFKYRSLYADIKDTLYNIETDKKLGSLQFDFDLEKKQSQINLLTKDKALTDLQLKRQKFAKNAFMVGLALIMMIALLIFRNYRIKVRTHKILDRQKGEIESLLLNILPSEVANELQVYGHAIPRNYEFVSVMFTDFKGFTAIADKMSPEELIQELNTCFIAFDDIIGKYGLEKIKTIGDSYMCAGGIPTADEHHVENMVKASLEICHFIRQYNQKRNLEGLESWDLRIGIHVGPVIAGVVGKKKYAYDIWGSTVNIASRLESNGMPGKVNISSSVFELIKDKYSCSYRGKINAKNIGDIDMYFLDGMAVIEGDETGINTNENSKTVPDLQGQEK